MRDAEDDKPEFRKETVEQLQGAGYYVTEENNGARIGAVPGSSRSLEELSPSDVVKMAAELDGGLKPQTTLPMCAACQSASPIGSTTCQWCGEPLPQS
jgi:CheY-like chemotaxis protein